MISSRSRKLLPHVKSNFRPSRHLTRQGPAAGKREAPDKGPGRKKIIFCFASSLISSFYAPTVNGLSKGSVHLCAPILPVLGPERALTPQRQLRHKHGKGECSAAPNDGGIWSKLQSVVSHYAMVSSQHERRKRKKNPVFTKQLHQHFQDLTHTHTHTHTHRRVASCFCSFSIFIYFLCFSYTLVGVFSAVD